MGVGYPLDLVVCVAMGVDMFDCVWPCRTARFGTAIVPWGLLPLKKQQFAADFQPIDANCSCYTCKNYTRAFLSTVAGREEVGCTLLTIHNIHQMMALMREMREAIKEDRFPAYITAFLQRNFPKRNYPQWVVDALTACGFAETVSDFCPSEQPEPQNDEANPQE